jgi:hypothetical protein
MKALRPVTILAAAFGIAAFGGVLGITDPPGPGLDPDAMSYLGAGLTFAHDGTFRVPAPAWTSADTSMPLAHFPPGFPATIAAGIAAGMTPVNAARFVEAVAAGITVAVVFTAVNAAGGLLAAFIAAAILFATPALAMAHASVLSEPLFFALLALFTWQMAREAPRERSTRGTILLGVLAAATALVRYAGASLTAALVLDALLATRDASWRERIRRLALAGVIPAVALGAWALSRPKTGGERIRQAGLYFAGMNATMQEGLDTVTRWLAPGLDSSAAQRGAGLAMLAALVLLLARTVLAVRTACRERGERQREAHTYRAAALIGASYAAVIGASRLLADPSIPFDDRMFAPIFVLTIVILAPALAHWWRRARPVASLLSAMVAAVWLVHAMRATADAVRDYRMDGGDLASREWRLSPLVEYARAADARVRLYSNWPAAIWFHARRSVSKMPEVLDAKTVAAFRVRLERQHGAVIAFTSPSPDAAPPDSLAKLAGLVPVLTGPDGVVWRAPADSAKLKP